MPMIVMKFGGTSTQDAQAMGNVIRIVKERIDRRPVVVISAIAQATNMLEQAGRLASEGKSGEARDTLLKLFERHYAIADALVKEPQRHRSLRKVIAVSLGELEELIKGLAILRELTPRVLDTIYSFGELLSSRIVAAALEENGVSTQWLDTKEFMITDERYNSASPAMDVLKERLTEIVGPLMQQGIVPVTQGFIGSTRSGHRTTMGRESSDYSASVIGAALNVEDVQIWTDVDGILTADPRIVPSPRKVKVLSFEEAFDLSLFGAKVLHPKTILPVMGLNISVHVYNSRRSDLSGSLVTAGNPKDAPCVKSVAFKRNMILMTVAPANRYGPYSFWGHVFNVLTEAGAVAYLTTTSDYGISFVLDGTSDSAAIAEGLKGIGTVTVEAEKGIMSIVGCDVRGVPRLVERVFRSLADKQVWMISFGASRSNLSLVIDDPAVPEAVRSLHDEFFNGAANETFEVLEHFQAPLQPS